MEILLWLVPAGVATCAAMIWVAWTGRDGAGEVDREEALARFAAAMESGRSVRVAEESGAPPAPRERSTGIAVRRSRVERPDGRGPA